MVGLKGPRKLLVASIGVATINYVLAGCETSSTSGNLPAPIAGSPGSGGKSSGGSGGGGKSSGGSGGGGGNSGTPPTVANLPFPEPMGGYPSIAGSAGQTNAGNGGSGNEAGGGGEAAGGADPSGGGGGGVP